MLRLRAQPKLRDLQHHLERALERVPVRAHGLHEIALRLRGELQAELQRLLPWIDDVRFERLREEVDNAVRLAEALEPLLHDAEALSHEVRQFEGRLPPAGDGHAAQRQRRCREWLAEIEHAPAAVTREAHVADARRQLEAVRSALHLHGESEHWLAEAARLLGALQDDPGAAALAADLPDLWEHVFTSGATRAWIDALIQRLRPLRELADRREVPPAEVHDADRLMAEIERWTHALEVDGRDLEELRRRHDLVVREWHQRPPEELDALVSEAAALRWRRLEQARQERTRLLDEFERELVDVLRACGEDAGLRALVDDLARRDVEHPQHHTQWKARHREARTRLRAVAQNQEKDLEARLAERVAQVETRLSALRAQPASEDGLRELNLLAFDTARLRGLTEIDTILSGLGQVAQIEARLAQFEQRAASEARALIERTQAQAVRAEGLRAALGLAGLEGVVSLAELDLLLEPAARPTTLTAAQARQEQIDVLLARLERECVEHCARRAEQVHAQAQALRAALQDAGCPLPPAGDVPGAPGDPDGAAQALLQARAALVATQAALETALIEHEEQQRRLEPSLSGLRVEDLGPAEAAEAEHLREQHRRAEWQRDDVPSERLQHLATLLLLTRSFLVRLDQGRQAVRTEAQTLRRRLKCFDEEHLRRFCPELAERVEGLVFGVPDDPGQRDAARAQLEQAATLLGRLERHARRLAMNEAQQAVDALRRGLRHSHDAAQRAADEALLAEWDQCGAECFAPLMLRLRLRERASLGAWGGAA